MRILMISAASALALGLAAPALAQAPALPAAGVTKAAPPTPVVAPRVARSNRPSVKVRVPVRRAGPASGGTLAQVKAPRHPGDSRAVRVRTTEGRALLGKGSSVNVKRNGVQATVVGDTKGVNTKRAGLPLTAASNLGAAHGPAATALGGRGNGHGVVGARVGAHPALINKSGGGGKHN